MKKSKKMIKARVRFLCTIIILVLIICGITSCVKNKKKNIDVSPVSGEQNIEESKEEISKRSLMIVAHPDDELIFGGAHLAEDEFFVVCVTNGDNEVRSKEFASIMEYTEDECVMLDFPDLTNGAIDDWSGVYDQISKELKEIIESEDWKLIVTHNPLGDGDYTHKHHRMVSEIVTNIASDKNLYYFGRYYSKQNVVDVVQDEISEELVNKKNEMKKLYKSQNWVLEKYHMHMFKFENWVKCEDWK